MTKDKLKEKAIAIKGKEYVQVKDRILFLAEEEADYSIETDYEYFESRKMWVVKAKLTYKGNVYTGLAQEIESSDAKQVNFSSALENAETSAVGRACAMAGIGVLDSIASVDEITKATNRQPAQQSDLGNCKTCGAVNYPSKTTGKAYCSKKCWLSPQSKPPVPEYTGEPTYEDVPF